MGVRPCGPKLIRQCEREVGRYILRVVGNGGNMFEFITEDHRHGWWDRRNGMVRLLPQGDEMHFTSCEWLFGPSAVDRSTWGLVDGTGRWRAVEWGKGTPPRGSAGFK